MIEKAVSMDALAARTRQVYERHAAAFDAQRTKRLHERAWLERFVAELPDGGSILDLGCGAGDPFPGWFTERGFRVTGVDFAEAMLVIARERSPQGDWRQGDMRHLDLGERFDGIIGWHSFFHLTRPEQRTTLPRLVAHLRPGGALMLTVGHEDGEVVGHVNREPVYHASLAPADYETLLDELGMGVVAFVTEDPDCDFASIILARKLRAG